MTLAMGAGIGIANTEEKAEVEPVAKVYVSIVGGDVAVANQVKSYLLRELRELKDVEIIDNLKEADSAFLLTMTPIEFNKMIYGHAVSWVLLEPNVIKKYMNLGFANYVEIVSEEEKQSFETIMSFLTGGVLILQKDSLKDIQSLITDFDIEFLEPMRQLKRKEKEQMDKYIEELEQRIKNKEKSQ